MAGICPFAQQIAGVVTFTQGNVDRVGWCDHTAGGYLSTMKNPGFWNNSQTSVHFAIGQDSQIIQLLNIFDSCWGQGKDANGNSVGPNSPGITWPPFATMGKRNPNGYLIATEHEDYDPVRHIYNPVWTDAMYAADLRVKKWCIEEAAKRNYNLLRFGVDSLAGHYMFDPVNRAGCPGNQWPRYKLYNDLTIKPEEDEMIRHNAIATWFDGRQLPQNQPGQFSVMQAQSDFQLPNEAREVLFAVYMDEGETKWFDGLSQNEAGDVGNRGVNYVQIRAILADGRPNIDSGKTLNFRAETDCTIGRVFCLGYW